MASAIISIIFSCTNWSIGSGGCSMFAVRSELITCSYWFCFTVPLCGNQTHFRLPRNAISDVKHDTETFRNHFSFFKYLLHFFGAVNSQYAIDSRHICDFIYINHATYSTYTHAHATSKPYRVLCDLCGEFDILLLPIDWYIILLDFPSGKK